MDQNQSVPITELHCTTNVSTYSQTIKLLQLCDKRLRYIPHFTSPSCVRCVRLYEGVCGCVKVCVVPELSGTCFVKTHTHTRTHTHTHTHTKRLHNSETTHGVMCVTTHEAGQHLDEGCISDVTVRDRKEHNCCIFILILILSSHFQTVSLQFQSIHFISIRVPERGKLTSFHVNKEPDLQETLKHSRGNTADFTHFHQVFSYYSFFELSASSF